MRWFDWRRFIYTHRWLGIAGGALFVVWFVSGVVMMYARMPGLANEERLARAPALDLDAFKLSPAEAGRATAASAERVQVGMLGDRPIYRFDGGRRQTVVFADNGEVFTGLSEDAAREVARRYAPGYIGPIHADGYLTEPDQWTLQAESLRPLHRFALEDDEQTRLYVSDVTGDVVLRTTRRERFWGYLGPVLHWVYFTPLRRNGPIWSEFLIWSSLIGCIMCLTGLVWGLCRLSPTRRFRLKRVSAASPYAGWMKWHHYAGLLFGVVTLTWTYSGLLSMGPFSWFSSPPMSRAQREASTGGPLRLDLLTVESLRDALTAVESQFAPKELDVLQVRGEPYWVAYRPPSEEGAVQWMHAGLRPRVPLPLLQRWYVSAVHPERGTIERFADEAMTDIAQAAMPGVPVQDAVWLKEYDGYYYDPRGSRPLPVLRIRYADAPGTWLYLDPARGGIVQRSVKVRRLQRWLYQGLHSLDFPFVYFKRPLWDITVVVLSIGGLVLSATTLLPSWRRLRRRARGFARLRTVLQRLLHGAYGSTRRSRLSDDSEGSRESPG